MHPIIQGLFASVLWPVFNAFVEFLATDTLLENEFCYERHYNVKNESLK